MANKSLILLTGISLILGLSFFAGNVNSENSCIEKGKGVCMPWNPDFLPDGVDIDYNGIITVDGDVSEWPEEAIVGSLWVAGKPLVPVGTVYLKNDCDFLYVGFENFNCGEIILDGSQYIRFEFGGFDGLGFPLDIVKKDQSCEDFQDNNGNSVNPPCNANTQYAIGDCAAEWRFDLDDLRAAGLDLPEGSLCAEDVCFGILVKAEIAGYRGTEEETATWPPRRSKFEWAKVCLSPDDIPPVLTGCPADLTLECDQAVPDPATPTATDECDDTPIVTLSETESLDECDLGTITRTWTASDDCGNESSCSQVITIVDTTPPVLSGVPADATVECDAIPDPANVTATDNCSTPTVTLVETPSLDECGEGTITRTWTAEDCFGNTTSGTQVLTVEDSTPPVITCPADTTLECPADTSPANTGSATGTDNCGEVTISSSDVSTAGCGNTVVIVRTWTAEDCAGNTSSCDQTITVEDNTAPVITCPADVTVECPDPTDPGATGSATASDLCDASVIPTHSDYFAPGCGATGIITRTWTATDDCGNNLSGGCYG
jgi:hypothetical protein